MLRSADVLRCDKLPILNKLGRRSRLTCLDASAELLAIGTNTGSIYFYHRSPLVFLKMIAVNVIGAGTSGMETITQVKIRYDLLRCDP